MPPGLKQTLINKHEDVIWKEAATKKVVLQKSLNNDATKVLEYQLP